MKWIGGVLLLTVVMVLLAFWRFPSLEASIAWIRGESVSLSPARLDLGSANLGEVKTSEITVINWTERPIRLIGGTTDCSCALISKLPVTIPPLGRSKVSVSIRFSATGSGAFSRKVLLLTDCEDLQVIRCDITGIITNATGED